MIPLSFTSPGMPWCMISHCSAHRITQAPSMLKWALVSVGKYKIHPCFQGQNDVPIRCPVSFQDGSAAVTAYYPWALDSTDIPKKTRFEDYQGTLFGIDPKVFLATQQFPSQNWFPGSAQQSSQYIPSSAWKHHLSAAKHQFRIRSQSNCRLCLNTAQSLDCQVTPGPVKALS